jgi:hypothetical protein
MSRLQLDVPHLGPSRYSVSAGDKQAVLDCIGRAKARCGLLRNLPVIREQAADTISPAALAGQRRLLGR